MEVYVSWEAGLPQDEAALEIIRRSGNIAGVELHNIDASVERIIDAGLKVASHLPGLDLLLNLAMPNYAGLFCTPAGTRVLEVIKKSAAPVVGFHCGYSAEAVHEMRGYPNVPLEGTLLTHRESIMCRIAGNVVLLENWLNSGIPVGSRKSLVLESMDYSRDRPIPWDAQTPEIRAKKDSIEAAVRMYGVNASLRYVTEPSFIGDVLDRVCPQSREPVGYLFDIAHNFISCDAKQYNGEFSGSIGDYFDSMLSAVDGRTFQLHLNVPEGDGSTGYYDHHNVFSPGKDLDSEIMALARHVCARSPEIKVLTLEMRTGLPPEEHANEMVKQAEYVLNELSR